MIDINFGFNPELTGVENIEFRLIVEGINMLKRHMRPNQENPQGAIVEKEGSIHVSNVQLVSGGKTTKIGYKILDDGKKQGIVSFEEALDSAKKASLDLVQVSPSDSEPVVCKLLDYGKYLFDKKKNIQSDLVKKTVALSIFLYSFLTTFFDHRK